jgi:RNA polymerase sigma-70 factor (ECF subfamily)
VDGNRRDEDVAETSLIEAARIGDQWAFGRLYALYLGDVREFCARRISDPLRAEDLAQETFLKAYESVQGFRSGAPFWPWLSTIARNLCVDELRQRRRWMEHSSATPHEVLNPQDLSDATGEEAVARERRRRIKLAIESALDQLDPRDRLMLWSHTVEEQSWERIAQGNGATVHAARNSVWRARNRLRRMLADSIHDLRARLAWPLIALLAQWRRFRQNCRNCQSSVYDLAALIASERMATFLVGLAMISMTFAPNPSRSIPSDWASQARPADSDAIHQPAVAGAHARAVEPTTDKLHMRIAPAKAKLKTTARPQAALPASTAYRIEISGLDGRTLYAEESVFRCGDGSVITWLPRWSPIQAYC